MNIVESIKDRNLFKPYLQGHSQDLSSWHNWVICLRVIYGLPVVKPHNLELIRRCTGRDPAKLPPEGFLTVLLLVGRRGGKSKISGLIGAYESSLSGKERLLSPGEIPMVTITSPTRAQSTIIKSYCRAALGSPMLEAEIDDDVKQGFKLNNGVTVRIMTGDFRSVRGFTQLMVIVDELCFFGYTEESRVRSDTELIRSIKPALLTTKGRLVCVSTKYAPKGWAHSQWKRHFGNDQSRTLVWDAASIVMNPTLSQEDIAAEIEDDPTAGRAEYLNLWREDIVGYLPIEVVQACVVPGRKELLADKSRIYYGFADLSGGRFDDAALAISFKNPDNKKMVISCLRRYKSPFNPHLVCGQMADVIRAYGLHEVSGDRYAGDFVTQSFKANGILYRPAEKTKSELYLDILGRLCSQQVELLDDPVLVNQFASLERRCRAGGRDIVDHPVGQKDDLANAVSGAVDVASKRKLRAGVFGRSRLQSIYND
jgi:hypothetical protein